RRVLLAGVNWPDGVGGHKLIIAELAQIAGKVQHQDGDQHEHAAQKRVQEELDGRVLAPWSAPYADQEVHRQEHHFPKHVKQEEVEREEHAQHSGLEQQKQDAVGPHVLFDGHAGGHREHADKGGQYDQRKADAVDAHEVLDIETGYPVDGKHLLHV